MDRHLRNSSHFARIRDARILRTPTAGHYSAGCSARDGAIVGSAVHNPGAGAAIGAGVGALSGAAIGAGQDEVEAKNRAMIESQLGHPIGAGSVTVPDVVAMTHAGVHEDLIINHIHSHGMVAPPSSNDLIYLSQQGISPRVVQVMQEPPPVRQQPVIVEECRRRRR